MVHTKRNTLLIFGSFSLFFLQCFEIKKQNKKRKERKNEEKEKKREKITTHTHTKI